MRTLALLSLAALALLAPGAAADQSQALGPVGAGTTSTDAGDCAGADGYSYRYAAVWLVPVGEHNVSASAANGCSAQTFGPQHWESQWLFVGVMKCGYGSCSAAGAAWSNFVSEYGSSTFQMCNAQVFAFGPDVQLGCPSPDGSGPPVLPPFP